MALIHLNESGFDKALGSDALMMVDFSATWCGPCQMLAPVMEQLADEYDGKEVLIGKVDVDENPELARRYGIMGVPTVLFLKRGEELDRKVGVMPFGAYADVLDGQLEQG